VDKFANPHFLAQGDPMNVAAQMAGYANSSPLAPLIKAAAPAAIEIGMLIALAEIAIGLGVLSGLTFRLAAAAGAAISLLFWLTASWSSTPYFFSPDLPYAFGFLTLALVGHGGLYVLHPFARRGATIEVDSPAEAGSDHGGSGRRVFLQMGLLAILTFAVAALSLPLRALGFGQPGGTGAVTPTRAPTPAPATPSPSPAPTQVAPIATTAPSVAATAAPMPTPAPTAPPSAPSASGPVIGNLADFSSGNNGIAFTVPMEAPYAMNPGGPGIMVELPDGSVAAFNAVCTHGRCTVGWDATTSIMQCPCHTARFDPANGATVLSGPAPTPLVGIPVAVGADGAIHVTAVA
jgi:thiosulfate dehydrogenase [quinone] large subunit